MDDININGANGNVQRIVPGGPPQAAVVQPSPQQPWKSYSLQRGTAAGGAGAGGATEVAPPKAPSNPIYASTSTNGDGTVVIRRPSSAKGQPHNSTTG